MSKSKLPERASIEYLKKIAKERLRKLRQSNSRAKLSEVQLAVAREHGFSSWRALKAEIDRQQANDVDRFFDACTEGATDTVREFVGKNPELVRSINMGTRKSCDCCWSTGPIPTRGSQAITHTRSTGRRRMGTSKSRTPCSIREPMSTALETTMRSTSSDGRLCLVRP